MTDNRTTELREKLTERGVKYDVKALRETEWTVNGVTWHANEYDGKLNVYVRNNDMLLTPEQAVAATLGGGTLTAEQVMAIAGKHQPDYCSDTHVCFDWQAIADELNAALGETNNGCYLMSDGKKFPVELDYGFTGLTPMPFAITVSGFRYSLEVPE